MVKKIEGFLREFSLAFYALLAMVWILWGCQFYILMEHNLADEIRYQRSRDVEEETKERVNMYYFLKEKIRVAESMHHNYGPEHYFRDLAEIRTKETKLKTHPLVTHSLITKLQNISVENIKGGYFTDEEFKTARTCFEMADNTYKKDSDISLPSPHRILNWLVHVYWSSVLLSFVFYIVRAAEYRGILETILADKKKFLLAIFCWFRYAFVYPNNVVREVRVEVELRRVGLFFRTLTNEERSVVREVANSENYHNLLLGLRIGLQPVAQRTLIVGFFSLFISTMLFADISDDKERDGPKLKFSGWAQEQYLEEKNKGSTTLKRLRLRALLEEFGPFSMFGEIELAHIERPDANWLQQFYLSYHINKDWKIDVGRVVQPVAYVTPPPFLLETIKYPKSPAPFFCYGVQTHGKFGKRWDLIASMSGNSDISFYKEDQFRRAELSGRISKKVGKFQLAGTGHFYSKYSIFGFDVNYSPTENTHIRAYGYIANLHEKDLMGGHVLTETKLLKTRRFDLKGHSQIDYQHKENPKTHADDLILTNGVTVETPKDCLSFTVDHEMYIGGDEPDKSRVFFGAQFRW